METTSENSESENQPTFNSIPKSTKEAAAILSLWAGVDAWRCRNAEVRQMLSVWHALLYLFPGLHPDGALENAEILEPWTEYEEFFPDLIPSLRFCIAQSQWPIAFVPLLNEMWRRYDSAEVSDEVFYGSEIARVHWGFGTEYFSDLNSS